MTNKDLSFFDTSEGFANLPDDITRQVVRSFILDQTDYKDGKLCLSRLCSIYPDVSISEVSYDVLNETLEKWSKAGDRKIFISLLIFAAQNNCFTDSQMQRLADFSTCIGTVSSKLDYLFYIISDEKYYKFRESVLFSCIDQPYALAVYCYRLNDSLKIDDDMRIALNEYIESIKFSANIATSTKFSLLRGVDATCTRLFDNQPSLTVQNVKSFLSELSPKLTTLRNNMLMSFYSIIDILYRKNMLDDADLYNLASVNANRNGNPPPALALNILESEHSEYWCSGSYNKADGATFTMYINHPSSEIRDTIRNFISKHYSGFLTGLDDFCKEFHESLGGIVVNSPKDFSFLTFRSQVKHFHSDDIKRNTHHTAVSTLVSFYLYLAQYVNDRLFEADGVPTSILNRPRIAIELGAGFEIIKYNQLEDVPASDKWLFCYKKYDRDTLIHVKAVDFSRIESKVYRNWIKHYAWKADVAIYTKFHPIPILTAAFNYLYDLKTGKQLSVFTKPGVENSLSVRDVTAYKNHVLGKYTNNRTRSGYIYNVRLVLKHVSDNHLATIESGVFYVLTHTLDQTYDNTQPIPNDQLRKLAKLLKVKSENDSLASVYSSIFFIALETEFRGSQIVDLNKNCLQETAKAGEYVIVSETKMSAGELVEQPISSYVEREIRHVITMTDDFREQCTDAHLHNKLFISPAHKRDTFKKITEVQFNSFLKNCCVELDIPSYTLENLRDTHMTKAEEYRIRNQLSDLEQTVLTGHATTAMDDIHYVKLDIRDMLEALHGVIIGDVNLDGKVYATLDNAVANTSNEVAHGCGWCNRVSCDVMMNLDCPMCKDFVTTVSRLPYFEEQIRILDQKIESATIPHDKEDYINIKRLMIRYMEEILKKKEEMLNVNK